MKYIYYIIAIMVAITCLTAFQLFKFKIDVAEPALIINDRILSDHDLDEMIQAWSNSYHMADLMDTIITNQLLIQEAIRLGINKEEPFRKSIENYYEQSLVKVLIDRKFKSFSPEISNAMVETYKNFSNSILEFTKEEFDSIENAEKGLSSKKETQTALFEDLSDELKFIMLSSIQGQRSRVSESGDGYVAYTLLSVLPSQGRTMQETDETMIREYLAHQEKQAMFNNWIDGLKAKSNIEILTDRK